MPEPNLNSSDLYAQLGCAKSCSEQDLKKAYRKLAVKYHPDKNPDDPTTTEKFQKISAAYATLSDATKRKMYDMYGPEGAQAAEQQQQSDGGGMGGGGGGMGGMPPGFGGSRGGSMPSNVRFGSNGGGMSREQSEQMFNMFFGGGGMGGGADPFASMFGGGGGGGGGGGRGRMGGMQQGMGGMQQGMGGGGDPFAAMFGGGGGMGGMPGGMGGFGGMPGGGMRGMPQAPQPAAGPGSIKEGTVVTLKGLQGAAHLNGETGVVRGFDSAAGRALVQLEDSEETMKIKRENLIQNIKVKVVGTSKPEINNQDGNIMDFDDESGRYLVNLPRAQRTLSLKAANVLLPVGAVVMIVGVQKKPELNGRWGTVHNFDPDKQRYEVLIRAGEAVSLKTENVHI